MQNHTKNSVNQPLYLLLAFMLLGTMVDAYWASHRMPTPHVWELLHAFLFSFTAFVWYCRDSDAQGYRRSLMRNIGFIFVAVLFVPFYLVRSRAPGQKWRALLRLAGFVLLMLLATGIGMLLIAMLT